jgi:hypothetical protein
MRRGKGLAEFGRKHGSGGGHKAGTVADIPYGDVCGKCGARRVDRQIGLEPTPDEFVQALVGVFREVRRVLRDDGTVFLNLGDSYATGALSMQRVWGDGNGARAGEGHVPAVLSPDGTATVLPVLRGDDSGVSDDRSRSERRGAGSGHGPAPVAQEDSGRGVPAGPLSDPLLELQRGEGSARGMSPYGDLKPKDLIGVPWMVAFALRADGWYLRSDIIWAKPNPMPESVTDRPTKAHEYLFLLSKGPRYFYDADAIREKHNAPLHAPGNVKLDASRNDHDRMQAVWGNDVGRNKRSVWTVATQPYSGAHFATFPPKLIEPCILAGSSPKACGVCGAPWRRVVERKPMVVEPSARRLDQGDDVNDRRTATGGTMIEPPSSRTIGWESSCEHDDDTGRSVVLDPFTGAGTVGVVCGWHGRDFIGCELNPEYAAMAEARIALEGRRGGKPSGHVPMAMPDGQLGLL